MSRMNNRDVTKKCTERADSVKGTRTTPATRRYARESHLNCGPIDRFASSHMVNHPCTFPHPPSLGSPPKIHLLHSDPSTWKINKSPAFHSIPVASGAVPRSAHVDKSF